MDNKHWPTNQPSKILTRPIIELRYADYSSNNHKQKIGLFINVWGGPTCSRPDQWPVVQWPPRPELRVGLARVRCWLYSRPVARVVAVQAECGAGQQQWWQGWWSRPGRAGRPRPGRPAGLLDISGQQGYLAFLPMFLTVTVLGTSESNFCLCHFFEERIQREVFLSSKLTGLRCQVLQSAGRAAAIPPLCRTVRSQAEVERLQI